MKYLLILFLLTGCFQIKNCKDVRLKITKVGMCEKPTADAFFGKHCGECRVELEDGTRVTVCGPIMEGDYHYKDICKLEDDNER